MKIYLVGGAVRDRLLDYPVKERDWVVVGSTPQELIAKGFKQVGKDFPVFLHPETQEEYALARTERKQAGCPRSNCESNFTAEWREVLLSAGCPLGQAAESGARERPAIASR